MHVRVFGGFFVFFIKELCKVCIIRGGHKTSDVDMCLNIKKKSKEIWQNMKVHPIRWVVAGIIGIIISPVIIAVVAMVAFLSVELIEYTFRFLFNQDIWEWLSGRDSTASAEGSNTVDTGVDSKGDSDHRINILIGLGSVLGIAVLAWRNYLLQIEAKIQLEQFELSKEQAKTATQQAKAAEKQSDRENRVRVSNQLTQSMERLERKDNNGEPLKDARIGGLYGLESLADEDPEGHCVRVMQRIIAYIRENAQKTADDMPTENGNADTDEQRARPLGEDVKVAFAILKRLYDSYAKMPEQRQNIKLVRFFDDGEPSDREYFQPKKPVRDDLDFSRADFHELDFRGVDWIDRPCCDRTDFREANLRNANLAGAHLEEALLQKVDAHDVNLYKVNLRDAQLFGAWLKKADLREAKLESAELDEADLEKAQLNEANLTYASLNQVNLEGAKMNEVILEGAALCATSMYGAELYGANLEGAWLHGVDLQMSRLVGADLSKAMLQGAYLFNTMLQGADLKDAQLDYGLWEHVATEVQDGNVQNLERLLEGKVKNPLNRMKIISRFNSRGNEGLWKPKSAQIFCHKKFPPLNYEKNPAIFFAS
ncbi:MAG: pentapeptide repeat-containing protein [Alphaproteobacteria bacterium GM202ARS2]|nr:pentapeptide repeat-containing protein [Alphaproteobacteria bacterium GM202ARS2]